jgi:hypothetical protein
MYLWTELAMLNLAILYGTQGQYTLQRAVMSGMRIRRGTSQGADNAPP